MKNTYVKPSVRDRPSTYERLMEVLEDPENDGKTIRVECFSKFEVDHVRQAIPERFRGRVTFAWMVE